MNCLRDFKKKEQRVDAGLENKVEEYIDDGTETKDLIDKALLQLSLEQKEVFILHYHFSYSFREVAALVGRSESTVKSQVYNAKGTVVNFLNKQGRVSNG